MDINFLFSMFWNHFLFILDHGVEYDIPAFNNNNNNTDYTEYSYSYATDDAEDLVNNG